jgi:hypothetical protein
LFSGEQYIAKITIGADLDLDVNPVRGVNLNLDAAI